MNKGKIGTGRDENRIPLYQVVPLKVPYRDYYKWQFINAQFIG